MENTKSYQESIQMIESILSQMDSADVDLDQLMNMVEFASVELLFCKSKLIDSEKKIQHTLEILDSKFNEIEADHA